MFDPVAFEAVSKAFQKQRNLFIEVLFDDKEAKERFVLGVKQLTERPDLDDDERQKAERGHALPFTLTVHLRLVESEGWGGS